SASAPLSCSAFTTLLSRSASLLCLVTPPLLLCDNELLGLDTDALMKDNIGMSMGNASFVLAMVQRKVRKVDKEHKKPLSWT
ncbi:MAG: hypothetical protein NXY57DRAFT_1021054, partial [Lentinula lateritia]